MADKVKQEWLLTPKELRVICIEHPWTYLRKYKNEHDEAVCQAQLAKAEPLIRQDERERILTIIEDWDRMTEEEGGEEKWQKKYGVSTTELIAVLEKALKGEGKTKTGEEE